MSIRAQHVRKWLAAVSTLVVLPASLLAVTAAPASAASCDLRPDTPGLTSDGSAVYLQGGGAAYCDGGASVEMLVREDRSGWWDRTVASAGGGSGQYLSRIAPCQAQPWATYAYYVELRVKSGGQEFKQQSDRVYINAYCG